MSANIERFARRIEASTTDPKLQQGAVLLRKTARMLREEGMLREEEPDNVLERTPLAIDDLKFSHSLFFYNPVDSTIVTPTDSVDLTKQENRFLFILFQRKEELVSRAMLQEALRGGSVQTPMNRVDVYIKRLRDKFEKAKLPRNIIESVKGVGYTLHDL